MYQLIVDYQAWPTGPQRATYTASSPFGLRSHLRNWKRFARYEDNHILSMRVVAL